MNQKQLERMSDGKGFIAALDQSGGSSPKALQRYGIEPGAWSSDEEMYDLMHEMRTRMMKSPSFDNRILGAILFENTMDRQVDGKGTADFLWEEKDGVQLMKPIPNLAQTLEKAKGKHIFGTKMRSVIHAANPKGIEEIVRQQFEIGKQIADAGLVPILEPEVDITIADKAEAEDILLKDIQEELAGLPADTKIMLKLSIPTKPGLYTELMKDPHIVRIVALSGGYSRKEANELLKKNPGLIASFSRALSEGLNANQTEEAFDKMMDDSIQSIYEASIA